MKRTNLLRGLAILAALMVLATPGGQAQADILIGTLGTSTPPATVGSYSMTEFGSDPSPVYSTVSSVTTPFGGSLEFSPSLSHYTVGNGWATWSNGYTGDVYYTGGGSSLTMTLSPSAKAFDFYVEPNDFSTFTVTTTAQNGSTASQSVDGNAGASGFYLYGTNGDTVSSITVTCSNSGGFAVGEFGINAVSSVPEPSGIALFGLSVVCLAVGYVVRKRTLALTAA